MATESASRDELVRMFRTHRGNIGGVVPTGRLVLDVDPRNGGVESIDRYVREHGPLPCTPTERTGDGGFHNHLVLPVNFAGQLGDGGSLAVAGFPSLSPAMTRRLVALGSDLGGIVTKSDLRAGLESRRSSCVRAASPSRSRHVP